MLCTDFKRKRAQESDRKKSSIFSYLKDQNCQFYFLQETYSKPNDEKIWRSEWGGDIFFSHGSTHSKGVCILINPSLSLKSPIEKSSKVQEGRIVSINLTLETVIISLCNVYAPNDSQQQQAFLHNLNEYLMYNTNIENLIIGGDWNVTLQSLDKKGGTPWKASAYRDSLISMMEELELIDVFRKQYSSKLCFSYESKALKVSSRIDFFLVARPLTNWVLNIETKASNAPDHKAIKLTLKLLEEKRGPGLWKFNNSLVEDEEYVKLIKEKYLSYYR